MDIFKRYNLKKTEQRKTLLEVLENSGVPLSAEDIFKNSKNISLATIYRALDIFCESGIINKISVGNDEKKYYELSSNNHRHYAVCLNCKHMEYIDFCPVEKLSLKDFQITGHRLELYGYCKNCSK